MDKRQEIHSKGVQSDGRRCECVITVCTLNASPDTTMDDREAISIAKDVQRCYTDCTTVIKD